MYDNILEPRKKYYAELERAHLENTTAYFEELVQQSGVDAAANKETCSKIYALEGEITALKKKEATGRGLFAGLIVLFLLLLFTGLIMIAIGSSGDSKNVLLIVLGVLIAAGSIALFIFGLIRRNKNAKIIAQKISEKSKELEEMKNKAWGQMAALNKLYEWNIYNIIMAKTTPLIEMDRVFDMEKYNQLKEKFNWNDPDYKNISTVLAQSGSILGNPFILARYHIQTMGSFTYTGSITIHWTERVSNGKGGYTTRSRSQTLTASITKPKPYYSYETKLIFGSEAAPDLTFSREPQSHGYDKHSLDKFFKQAEKRIDDYAKKHPGFTPLGNDQFEDFFGGLDRDHEVQYRLLFTPLAQKAMLELLTNAEPYGDDFSFKKEKMINTIISRHSQNLDFDGYPSIFYHFDLEKARENFINLNVNYFKGLFFDLAPLLAIPLYQQYPTNDYIFHDDIGADYSRHLSEMEANRYNDDYFKSNESITPNILKSEFVGLKSGAHAVYVHAHGFKGIEHTDYVRKMGGDGRNHDIPVHWIEYVPVEKVTPFTVQPTELNRHQFNELLNTEDYQNFLSKNVSNNAILCSRGIFSFINRVASYTPEDLQKTVEKILNKQ